MKTYKDYETIEDFLYHNNVKERLFESIRTLKEFNLISKKMEEKMVDETMITYIKIIKRLEKERKCKIGVVHL
jgi:hypothetical protein